MMMMTNFPSYSTLCSSVGKCNWRPALALMRPVQCTEAKEKGDGSARMDEALHLILAGGSSVANKFALEGSWAFFFLLRMLTDRSPRRDPFLIALRRRIPPPPLFAAVLFRGLRLALTWSFNLKWLLDRSLATSRRSSKRNKLRSCDCTPAVYLTCVSIKKALCRPPLGLLTAEDAAAATAGESPTPKTSPPLDSDLP